MKNLPILMGLLALLLERKHSRATTLVAVGGDRVLDRRVMSQSRQWRQRRPHDCPSTVVSQINSASATTSTSAGPA